MDVAMLGERIEKPPKELPQAYQVIQMTHLELIDVLSECAESPYFGDQKLFLPYKKARKLALMLVQPKN